VKIKLISCGICEHWHMPKAHNGHCPACGSYMLVVGRKRIFFNWSTEREVIKSGFPMIIKRLLHEANA
jgi:hypothetical protein